MCAVSLPTISATLATPVLRLLRRSLQIITRANELREDPLSLSRRYCDEFLSDMHYLQCLPPSVEPRVSDHMPQIIDMIQQIIANGCAYVVEGDVYFLFINSLPMVVCLDEG